MTTHYLEEAGECDRLVIMADGAVVAGGTPAEVIGDATVTVVEAPRLAGRVRGGWRTTGWPWTLAGTTLRVPGAGPGRGSRQATGADPVPVPGPAVPSTAPATLEERFFQLVQHSQDGGESAG